MVTGLLQPWGVVGMIFLSSDFFFCCVLILVEARYLFKGFHSGVPMEDLTKWYPRQKATFWDQIDLQAGGTDVFLLN